MLDPIRRRTTLVAAGSLVLAQLACGGAEIAKAPPGPTTGSLVVVLQARGNGRDADGFVTTLDREAGRPLPYEGTVVYGALPPGEHVVRIDGVAPHCRATEDSTIRTVRSGVTDTIAIEMTCLGGFAYHQLIDSTRYDIAYLTEDGRTIQLTNGPNLKFIESWSPDGTRMLYAKLENGEFHLYSVRADGTDTRMVSVGPGNDYSPQWSPDASHIAYMKGDPTDGSVYIAVADPDGANRRVLVDRKAIEFDVTWSADGARLYFGCNRFQRSFDLCTAAFDGSDVRPIRYAAVDAVVTPCAPTCLGSVGQLAASPDGRTIAFQVYPNNQNFIARIWVGSLDGSSAVPLSGATLSYEGRWSPSGDRLVLGINDGAYGYALATVNRDGSGYRQLTAYGDHDESPTWSADGAVIAFDELKAGQQIWAMNADGSGRRQLTMGGYAFAPRWNPRALPTGRLPGGDRVSTTSRQAPAASFAHDDVGTTSTTPSNVCHWVRVGGMMRISCPSSH